MGGSIALMYAARYSGDVTALVGVGAPAEFPDQARTGLEARAQTVEAEGMGAVAETVATNGVSPTFREGQPEGFREAHRDARGERSRRATRPSAGRSSGSTSSVELADVRAPALLISGDRDGVSPPAVTEANAGRIPGGRFEIVEDCGHILTWEKPQELARAAWPFLREQHELEPVVHQAAGARAAIAHRPAADTPDRALALGAPRHGGGRVLPGGVRRGGAAPPRERGRRDRLRSSRSAGRSSGSPTIPR